MGGFSMKSCCHPALECFVNTRGKGNSRALLCVLLVADRHKFAPFRVSSQHLRVMRPSSARDEFRPRVEHPILQTSFFLSGDSHLRSVHYTSMLDDDNISLNESETRLT